MKHILDASFKYTPASEQGPDYLKKKFDRIRREREAARREEESRKVVGNVQALPRKVAK